MAARSRFRDPDKAVAVIRRSAQLKRTFTCTFNGIAPVTDNQYTISYDRDMRGGKDHIAGRWFWDEGDATKPLGTASNLAFPRTDTQWNRFFALTETHNFSATKVNEFRFGFSRFLFANIPTDLITLQDVGAQRGNSASVSGNLSVRRQRTVYAGHRSQR